MARRILLADDSVTAQNMGRRILADAGYEVVTVNNGSAALKKIAENKPDIIVLDVYMPGYGGLEVCQRVKQSPDTARIPVLLTVGKLEPFKPEEARRVGADAFIIKPFEATELLTALTKLEDKIVAGPQPQKSGRFARALAAVEQSGGERFGDKETGWKNRLTIPAPNTKPAQETEAPETSAGPARDFDRSEATPPVEAKQEFERPIPAGLPADITAEEIAAITAAAASFDGTAGHPTVIPEGSASESAATMQAASAETTAVPSSEPEVPAATLASVPEPEPVAPVEVAAEAAPAAPEAAAEAIASSEAVPAQEQAVAPELPAPVEEAVWVPPTISAPPAPAAEQSSQGDDEVMAAIASLAPSNGHGGESVPASGANGINQVPVALVSAVATEAAATGARWIAESVAVALEESAPTLEQEMELAAAAQVAAEAARNEAAAAAVEVQPAPPAVEAAETTVAAEVSVAEAVASAEPAPALSVAAESIAAESVSTESVSTESNVSESAVAESAVTSSASENQVPESVSTESAPVKASEPAASNEEPAFAAAAAAGAGAEGVSTVDAVSSTTVSPEISETAAVAHVEVTPQREAELAAAWQNWKQIRESFVSAEPSAPVAEAPVEAITAREEVAAPAEEEDETETEAAELEVASEAPGESTAIASIVDTMLAELRPKLVAEIAKKMSSEKKEKEKKKKK